MSLADLFLSELEKLPVDTTHEAVRFLGRELAKGHKETLDTLSSIASLYVKIAELRGGALTGVIRSGDVGPIVRRPVAAPQAALRFATETKEPPT